MASQDCLVLVTAAGSSERFGGGKKEFHTLGDRSVLDMAVRAFLDLPGLKAMVITAQAGREAQTRAALSQDTLARIEAALGSGFRIAAGGPSRRDSVRLGLEALADLVGAAVPESGGPGGASPRSCTVLVHDGARPWLSPGLARRVAQAARDKGAAIPLVPLVETAKKIGAEGLVLDHPDRSTLGLAQTPQGFDFARLLAAHRLALKDNVECTDDAQLWDRYEGKVSWIEGERSNRKISFRDDVVKNDVAEGPSNGALTLRVGEGWDIHRLVRGRKLFIGGVEIPSDRGEDAHSDGDVLLHALIDALLGAGALGDIGTHFPPQDPRWKDADSRELAARVMGLASEAGLAPVNLDCSVILERPRLAPHAQAIRLSLAAIFGLPLEAVSFKAKTAEGLGAVGEGLAVEARALILMSLKDRAPRPSPLAGAGPRA